MIQILSKIDFTPTDEKVREAIRLYDLKNEEKRKKHEEEARIRAKERKEHYESLPEEDREFIRKYCPDEYYRIVNEIPE